MAVLMSEIDRGGWIKNAHLDFYLKIKESFSISFSLYQGPLKYDAY